MERNIWNPSQCGFFDEGYTVIYHCDEGYKCIASETIKEFVLAQHIENDVLAHKKAQQAAQEKQQKINGVKNVVKVVALVGGAAVKVALGGHRGENTGNQINKAVDKLFGADSDVLYFDEAELWKEYKRIAGTSIWARCYLLDCFSIRQKSRRKTGQAIFRGLPSNYIGIRNKERCITYQIEDTIYWIAEYADVHTANQVWTELKNYGFA